MGEYKINGHAADVSSTTPNAVQKLKEADELLRKWNKENEDKVYLFDKEFRGEYFEALADIVVDWQEENFNPGREFFESGDFEVSKIREVRSIFLARAGMIST